VALLQKMATPYRSAPEHILISRASAGGISALHHAYVEADSEIPVSVDPNGSGLGDSPEGNSGNAGHSSDVFAVFSIAGGLNTADNLGVGDVPLASVHDAVEETVCLYMVPTTGLEGSGAIHENAIGLGIDPYPEVFEGVYHVPHAASTTHCNTMLAVWQDAFSHGSLRTLQTNAGCAKCSVSSSSMGRKQTRSLTRPIRWQPERAAGQVPRGRVLQ